MASGYCSSNKLVYLTEDFKYIRKVTKKEEAFQEASKDRYKIVNGTKSVLLADTKNLVWCINPTFSFESYYNYLSFLNQVYDDWNCYGLFDIGYKPYVYLPSFWGQSKSPIGKILVDLAMKADVDLKPHYNTSFMYPGKAIGPAEYWIKDIDLCKILDFCYKIDEDEGYHFINMPETAEQAKTSELIKSFVGRERIYREKHSKDFMEEAKKGINNNITNITTDNNNGTSDSSISNMMAGR